MSSMLPAMARTFWNAAIAFDHGNITETGRQLATIGSQQRAGRNRWPKVPGVPPLDARANWQGATSNVYLLQAGPYLKIGKADDIDRRIQQLQTACPEKIELIARITCGTAEMAHRIEGDLHWRCQPYHTTNEWFALHPRVLYEFFSVGDSVMLLGSTHVHAMIATECRYGGSALKGGTDFLTETFITDSSIYAAATNRWRCMKAGRPWRADTMVGYSYAMHGDNPWDIGVTGWVTLDEDAALQILGFDGLATLFGVHTWRAARFFEDVHHRLYLRSGRPE